MFGHQQSTNGSFGDLSTFRRLTWGRLPSVSGGLNQVSPFTQEVCASRTTPDLLWSQTTDRPWRGPESSRGCRRNFGEADGCLWFLSFALPPISPSAYTLAYRRSPCTATADERGTAPVKLTNHFPQAKPPTTLTLDRQLTVSAADRRTFESRSAVLHHFAEAGTSSRPNRDSSRGLVPWLLRYHCLG